MDSGETYPVNPTTAPHPGEVVGEFLDHLAWSQLELARRTGLTAKTISEIRNGKGPITPPTALSLEKVLGRPAHFWLKLQCQYDESVARLRAGEHAEGWREWAARFPIKELREWGFIESGRGVADADAILSFFGVSSPQTWTAVWNATPVAYRQTRSSKITDEAVSAWVRATEIEAASLRVEPFHETRLRGAIAELRGCTLRRAQDGLDLAQRICASAGVALVWVPALRNTGISGCARWLSPSRALIGLSLRYKTDDRMWFTFFHELGHILLHRGSRAFVLDNPDDDFGDRVVDPEMQRDEEEADRFASDTMIPPESLARFLRAHKKVDNDSVLALSEDIGIAPGIIVGRLQHEGILEQWAGNHFKQKLSLAVNLNTDNG